MAELGIGVNIAVYGTCHMEPKITRIRQPGGKWHHPHHPPPISGEWLSCLRMKLHRCLKISKNWPLHCCSVSLPTSLCQAE